MKEVNKLLFDQLRPVAAARVGEAELKFPRAIATTASEKKWIKDATVEKPPQLVLGLKARICFVKFDSVDYIILIGLNLSFGVILELEVVPIHAGIFTLVAGLIDVGLADDSDLDYQLANRVFQPLEDVSEVKCHLHNFEEIIRFFRPFQIFKIKPESGLLAGDDKMYRTALAVATAIPGCQQLPWTRAFVDQLLQMALDRSERTPFVLLFYCLTEVRPEAAFLNLYRCIEQLFPIAKIEDFSKAVGLMQPVIEVASKLEEFLGWRRPETESIEELMTLTAVSLQENLYATLGLEAKEATPTVLARRVYALRNQCVHFRPVHSHAVKNDPPNWILLCEALLGVVQDLYASHRKAFDSAVSSG